MRHANVRGAALLAPVLPLMTLALLLTTTSCADSGDDTDLEGGDTSAYLEYQEFPAIACVGDAATVPMPLDTAVILTAGRQFDTGSVALMPLAEPDALVDGLLVTSGDAALRRVGREAVVLNRGAASNLLFLDGNGAPRAQVSLGRCNPHDIELIDDCRLLVSCYDTVDLAVVDLRAGTVSGGPDLKPFADVDGLPEADQFARIGDRIFVTLQLLDRDAFYTPTASGKVAVLDATTLALIDVDAAAAGVQLLDLGCTNPYSDLSVGADGRLYAACLGDVMQPGLGGIAALDPVSGESELVASEAALGGTPSTLALGADGAPYALVSSPNAVDPNLEMRVVAVSETDAEAAVLLSSPDFTLSGLAVDPSGTVYVGNRAADANAGLWILAPGAAPAGPIQTSQPPLDIQLF